MTIYHRENKYFDILCELSHASGYHELKGATKAARDDFHRIGTMAWEEMGRLMQLDRDKLKEIDEKRRLALVEERAKIAEISGAEGEQSYFIVERSHEQI